MNKIDISITQINGSIFISEEHQLARWKLTKIYHLLPKIPIPSHSIPFHAAPPSTASHSQIFNNTTAGRNIHEPAVPSKCAIPERTLDKSNNSFDVANAFKPQELAEIVATTQHFMASRNFDLLVKLKNCDFRNKGLFLFKSKSEVEAKRAIREEKLMMQGELSAYQIF